MENKAEQNQRWIKDKRFNCRLPDTRVRCLVTVDFLRNVFKVSFGKTKNVLNEIKLWSKFKA